MNGVHDMGGMHGMGPIRYEKNEPVFHAPWEGRVYAIDRALAAFNKWNLDAWRHHIELLPPADYLRMSYYEKWLAANEARVVQYGLVTADELENGKAAGGVSEKATPALTVEMARSYVRNIPSAKDPAIKPLFDVGQRVRARDIHPAGHTRLPRYARAKTGTIEAVRGCHVFPDTAALGAGESPQWLYTVVFTARELWGEDADPAVKVSIEAFEPYLDPI